MVCVGAFANRPIETTLRRDHIKGSCHSERRTTAVFRYSPNPHSEESETCATTMRVLSQAMVRVDLTDSLMPHHGGGRRFARSGWGGTQPEVCAARNDKVLGRERAAIAGRGPAARDRTSPPGGTTGGGSHSSSFAVYRRQVEHSPVIAVRVRRLSQSKEPTSIR